MRLVQTNDAGVAVLQAAGLPCVELQLTAISQPAKQIQHPLKLQQPAADLTPRTIDNRTHPSGYSKAPRHNRWHGVHDIMLGQNVPREDDSTQAAWAYRKVADELRLQHKGSMTRDEAREFLGAAYELEIGKKISSYSHLVTLMLDRGYVSPVRT